MLIITRKLGERITIGDDIVVTLLDIRGGQARLGVEAPGHVAVHREEIFERIRKENLASSRIKESDLMTVASMLTLESNCGEKP